MSAITALEHPRHWRRSPDRLSAAVAERFRHASYLELRNVDWRLEDGTLKLRGHVSSYYVRQIAQTVVQGLDGVEAIDNQLEVLPPARSRR
jgi:osmotically-inducible protein OsmY